MNTLVNLIISIGIGIILVMLIIAFGVYFSTTKEASIELIHTHGMPCIVYQNQGISCDWSQFDEHQKDR